MNGGLTKDPERWRRIEHLFEAARHAEPAARREIIEVGCGGDETVRREVEALLEEATGSGDRLSIAISQAVQSAFPDRALQNYELHPGDPIGAYRVRQKLGAGGMGAVYLAERADGEFQRTVAVKIIRPELVNRSDLLLRFRKERQILADLDHPNIARMLDGGVTQAGVPYLVMEYVKGAPILQYCEERDLSVAERLTLFCTVCDAVHYAHDSGVVHRDIKPGNILVGQDGKPKLLDFGIARIIEGGGEQAPETASTGLLMTPEYASPEVIRGESPGKRSDVYALGVILFELLAGYHPFRKPGQSSRTFVQRIGSEAGVVPAELKSTRLEGLPSGMVRALDAIVTQAMQAHPADRYASAQALASDIRHLLTGMPVRPRRRRRILPVAARHVRAALGAVDLFVRRRPRLAWAALAIVAAFALLTAPAAFVHYRERRPAGIPLRFQIEPPEGARFVNPVISPDGQKLVFTGMQTYGSDRLWIRTLDSTEPKPLPGTEGVRGVPVWSPDSRFLAITTPGKLKKIDLSGRPPEVLCDSPNAIAGGSWSTDGRILFGSLGGGVSQVAPNGVCAPVTQLNASRGETMHGFPVLLPDRKHFLYVVRGAPEHSGIYIGAIEQNGASRLGVLLTGGSWTGFVPPSSERDGALLFVRDGTLYRQQFDITRLQLTGDATVVASGLASVLSPAAASSNGVLAWQNAAGPRQLVWMDIHGTVLSTIGSPGLYNRLALSPNGRQLAVEIGNDSRSDIWLMELDRDVSQRFTFDPHLNIDPVWFPDGGRVLFASNRAGRFQIYRKSIAGTAAEEILVESDANKFPVSISKDGLWMMYTQVGRSTGDDLWVEALSGNGNPYVFAGEGAAERLGVFSPDGRYVAYMSDESGRFEVYVRSFPPSPQSGKRVVSSNGGAQPRWSPDGKKLYFIAPDGRLMQTEVTLSSEFHAGAARALFQTRIWSAGGITNGHRWDIAPDGRFLINTATSPVAETFTVRVN